MSGEALERRPVRSEGDAARAREEYQLVKKLLDEAAAKHGAAFTRNLVIHFDEAGRPEVRHRDGATPGRLSVAAARLKLDKVMGWAAGETERRSASAGAALSSARATPAPARKPILDGYALVFGALSEDLGGFFERIDGRAVNRTLREKIDVIAVRDHDVSRLLARVTAQTLRLAADTRGLHVEIDPPNTSDGHDVLALVARGDLRGMSFAFRIVTDEWSHGTGGLERLVTDMRVHEVSVVAMPAYPATTIHARGLPRSRAENKARHDRVTRELAADRARLASRWN